MIILRIVNMKSLFYGTIILLSYYLVEGRSYGYGKKKVKPVQVPIPDKKIPLCNIRCTRQFIALECREETYGFENGVKCKNCDKDICRGIDFTGGDNIGLNRWQNGRNLQDGGNWENDGILDQRINGGMLDQRRNGGLLDQRRNSGIFDQRRNGGILDQRINGGILDQRINGGILDQRINGGFVDGFQDFDPLGVGQRSPFDNGINGRDSNWDPIQNRQLRNQW